MQISSIDLSGNPLLEHADFYRNTLVSIDVSNNPSLRFLALNNINTFNGVINLSNNPNLEELICTCQAKNLDVSNNLELKRLSMVNNDLSEIDLSNNTKLEELNLSNNKLISLDVSNNPLLIDLDSQGNLDLNCINTSSDQLLNIPSDWVKSDNTQYSDECDVILQTTNIPDNNFEQALIDFGYDDVLDGVVLTSNIKQVAFLDLTDKNINDLTGIQDFIMLESITSNIGNEIEGVLDLSSNTNLSYVDLANNQLSELYLNNNSNLLDLYVYNNPTLSILEIENSPNLQFLNIHDNLVTDLDLSNSPKINKMRIWNSKLESLDLSNQTELEVLRAQNIFKSAGKSIDLSNNPLIKIIDLRNNPGGLLDSSNNTNAEIVVLSENDLNSIDLSSNSQIRILSLQVNNLSSLDLSSINNLTLFRGLNNEFDCVTLSETQINNIPPSCLDLGIPDNFNPQDPNQEACYGWELVDLSNSYDYTSTWVLDEGVSFSLSCGAVKTNIPDDNFEQALINLGYDNILDDSVLTPI